MLVLHVTTDRMLVTTTEILPGYRIERILGPVLGVAAHARSPFAEGLRSVADGHSVSAEHRRELFTSHRVEAVRRMLDEAGAFGANAVVAMRFDHRPVTDMWNEICAYGTAVWAVPLESSPD
jgi:uncharacterized protein YbjQ (UPF0145 family)